MPIRERVWQPVAMPHSESPIVRLLTVRAGLPLLEAELSTLEADYVVLSASVTSMNAWAAAAGDDA